MKNLIGAHVIISSRKPEADRAFLREVFTLPYVDAGDGWAIFGLPAPELAVHPAARNDEHELYLMVKNMEVFINAMRRRRVKCAPVADHHWGVLTSVRLRGGGRLGVYEPRHKRPPGRAAGELRAALAVTLVALLFLATSRDGEGGTRTHVANELRNP
ncbi:MAG: extradiol dioxygenase [Acidobacteriota bacterium]